MSLDTLLRSRSVLDTGGFGADDVAIRRAGHGDVRHRRIELQVMAVAQDEPVVGVVKQEALRETFDDGFAGAGFVQNNSSPDHRAVRLASRTRNRMSVFLASVAGDERGFDVPHGERFGGRQQPLAEFRPVVAAVCAEQRIGIGENFLRVDAEDVAGAFADVGIVDPFVGRDDALVQDDAWQAGQRGEALRRIKYVCAESSCCGWRGCAVELACPGAVGARLSEVMFRGIAVMANSFFEPSAGSGSTLPIPDKT